MENHECTPICSRRYMGSFRWWMQGGIASSWIHVICLGNTLLPRGVTRFAWWRQGLHAIELLRAHIGDWTITRMLDYWWVMCFTHYRLNCNPWIWIPFPVDSDCTLLCSQVDRTRYSSIASGNNCIVQLCKWLCFITPLVGSVDSPRVLVACSFASVGFFGNNKSSTQTHGSLSLRQLKATIL
jgi:hypothetical protein